MSIPLHSMISDVLRQKMGERLSPKEIASLMLADDKSRFADKERRLNGRTTLLDQLSREVYANIDSVLENHADIGIDRTKRPLNLFAKPISTDVYTQNTLTKPKVELESLGVVQIEKRAEIDSEEIQEFQLYKPLIEYLREQLNIFSVRINESTSKNRRGKNGNKWLHPDIVGMEAPAQNWISVVRECASELPAQKAKLTSIEVKVALTSSNIREAFFQAVSNSLWANTAYLVSTSVEGDETLAELRMLCALHGVGYIDLDPDTPQESRVLIPAKIREEIDWTSADRLARENSDFQSYLDHVLNYLRTGKVVRSLWG